MWKLGLLVLILLAVVFAPFTTIWALNTLFPVLAIPYTFWTWLAVLSLGGISLGRYNSSGKK